MFTDVVGYTALMQENEEAAREVRRRHRLALEQALSSHGGELLQYLGDGSLSIFPSAVRAVSAAVEVQRTLREAPAILLRIGIHQGEIAFDTQGGYGDSVNVASRIQGLASAGSVLVSDKVHDELKNQPGLSAKHLGEVTLKNVKEPVGVYAVIAEGLEVPSWKEQSDPSASPLDDALPRSIGPYRILRLLGEGGMGLVYEAEQRTELRRRVALKVLRPGVNTRDVLARFEAERQALAVMRHPGISEVFDAGATEDGRPYFVMELVDGEPITHYADNNKLGVEERVRVFIQVCRAVQHAHQKGVIHRDLKPSNILVTVRDDMPVPKIIDFGIAKATGEPLTERTLVTQLGRAVGTPAYMSPEQAGASQLDVDTRSDIYSLGVTLYELLVGKLPVDPRDIGAAAFLAQLMTKDTDPITPSTRYATLDKDLKESIARFRRTDSGSLRRDVHGDLDWVVLKAIDKDRERRYDTANALATDLERHLKNEPVFARPPSVGYRTSRFVKRHRWGVASVGAIGALVLTSTALVARARVRAEAERASAGALEAFMDEILESADPYDGLGGEVAMHEVLDSMVSRLDQIFAEAPAAKAAVMDAMGRSYLSRQRLQEARALLEAALAIRRDLFGNSTLEVASSVNNYASVLHDTEHFPDAEPLYREAKDLFRALGGEDSGLDGKPTANLALLLDMGMGRYEEAEEMYKEAIEIGERALAASSPAVTPADLALWRHNYAGFLCVIREDAEEGVRLENQAIATLEEIQPSTKAAVSRSMLGRCLTDLGRFPEAEAQLLQALAELEANLQGDDPRVHAACERLARLYDLWGKPNYAAVYRERLERTPAAGEEPGTL